MDRRDIIELLGAAAILPAIAPCQIAANRMRRRDVMMLMGAAIVVPRSSASSGQTPKVIAFVLPAAPQLAGFADRISRGSRPEVTPIEQPTRYEMVVNLKTALALGLIGPVSILLQADEVIE